MVFVFISKTLASHAFQLKSCLTNTLQTQQRWNLNYLIRFSGNILSRIGFRQAQYGKFVKHKLKRLQEEPK